MIFAALLTFVLLKGRLVLQIGFVGSGREYWFLSQCTCLVMIDLGPLACCFMKEEKCLIKSFGTAISVLPAKVTGCLCVGTLQFCTTITPHTGIHDD